MKQAHIVIIALFCIVLWLYFDNRNLSYEVSTKEIAIEKLKLSNQLKNRTEKNTELKNKEQPKATVEPKGFIDNLKQKLIGSELEPVKIYDLTQKLPEDWKDIQCRKSARIQETQTTLCVHDIASDVHVSGSIWSSGVWEADIIAKFMNYIHAHPDWLVLDFGAQIGQYSLFAASMGRKVLTVEPFYDNIKRIHKAAVSENIGSNIKLVRNAITNKRHEIMLLQKNSNNIGGQAIDHSKTYTKEEMATNKYLVETILMDDLVDQIPLKADGKKFTSAILKIDIEGSEPFAFKHAEKFFDALDIQIIFMEWGNFPKISGLENHVEEMIDFLMERSFLPYVDQRILLKGNWKTSWPWDIIWKKKVGK